MKNIKLIFPLLPFFSFMTIMTIDSGWAMMSTEAFKVIPRIVVKQRAPQTQMMRKSPLHTRGYKPENSIPDFQFDAITQEKNRFTDKSHERYRSEVTDPSLKDRVATMEQLDDHTLLVNIRETEENAPLSKAQDELNNDKLSSNMQVQDIDANMKKYENKILETPVIPKNTPKSYDLPATFFIENRKDIILNSVNGRIFHAHRDINMEKELFVAIDSGEEAENKQFAIFKEADEKSGDHRY